MKRSVHVFAGLALMSACSGDHIPTATTAGVQASESAANELVRSNQSLQKGLETIRRVTAPFHDFELAKAAGWNTEITPCLVNSAGPGAMGFHYGNTSLIDGTAQVDKPQLLLYEPEANGRLRLLAVEYIIPYTFVSRTAAPPVLLGQQFLPFDAFGVWGLHVWIWKDNPAGLFAPWNTQVTCNNASDVAAMVH